MVSRIPHQAWRSADAARAEAERLLGREWFERFCVYLDLARQHVLLVHVARASAESLKAVAERVEAARDAAQQIREPLKARFFPVDPVTREHIEATFEACRQLLDAADAAQAQAARVATMARAALKELPAGENHFRPMARRAIPSEVRSGVLAGAVVAEVPPQAFASEVLRSSPDCPFTADPATWAMFAVGSHISEPPRDVQGWSKLRAYWGTVVARASGLEAVRPGRKAMGRPTPRRRRT